NHLRAAGKTSRLAGLALVIWIGFFAFVNWKYGFVRADAFHLTVFFSLVPLLAAALTSGGIAKGRLPLQAMGIAASILALWTLQQFYFQPLGKSLFQPLRTMRANCGRLLQPAKYLSDLAVSVEQN